MKSRALSTPSLDLRPLFAVAVLGMVALSPAGMAAPVAGASPSSSLMAAAAEIPFEATADSLNLVASQINEVNSAAVDVVAAYAGLFSVDAAPQTASAAMAPSVPQGESIMMTLAYMPQSLYETVGNTTDFLAAVEMAPLYVVTDALSQTLFEAGLY